MRASAVIVSVAAFAAGTQAQYGATPAASSLQTIQTTSTNYITKTVYAATHTSTVTMTSHNSSMAASSGAARPTNSINTTSAPIVPVTSGSDAVAMASKAQGALFGALVVGALFL